MRNREDMTLPPAKVETDIAAFRKYIYGQYEKTHQVYSDALISDAKGRRAQIRRLLYRHLPTNRQSRIVDFGCGDGLLLSVAAELGYTDLHGVDVSKGLVEVARARVSAKIDYGDGFEYLQKLADNSVNVIVAFDVLEHFTRPELLNWCKDVSRVLAAKGLLLVHVPNGASPFSGSIRWGDITHELAFTSHSLEQVLRPLGFSGCDAWEDVPVIRGVKSLARASLWQVVRIFWVALLAIETGVIRGHILTMNFFFTANKS